MSILLLGGARKSGKSELIRRLQKFDPELESILLEPNAARRFAVTLDGAPYRDFNHLHLEDRKLFVASAIYGEIRRKQPKVILEGHFTTYERGKRHSLLTKVEFNPEVKLDLIVLLENTIDRIYRAVRLEHNKIEHAEIQEEIEAEKRAAEEFANRTGVKLVRGNEMEIEELLRLRELKGKN